MCPPNSTSVLFVDDTAVYVIGTSVADISSMYIIISLDRLPLMDD